MPKTIAYSMTWQPGMFRDVVRIHTNAQICFESDKPEASWGEEVVRPLLDLAISRTDGRAVVENVFVP